MSQPGAPRLSPLEPPLSPPPVGAEPPVSAPAPASLLRAAEPPAATVPPAPQVSLEAQLLRFGLVAPDQMSEAMRVEAETGKSVAETVVERGWVSAGDLAQVYASIGIEPEPEPEPVREPEPEPAPSLEVAPLPPAAPEPEPEPELPPAAAVEPEPPVAELLLPPPPAPAPVAAPAPEPPVAPPAPPPRGATRVVVRLRSGEELEAGSYDDPADARSRAKELVGEVQAEDAWPFVAGRSVSPEEIDTIFLEKR